MGRIIGQNIVTFSQDEMQWAWDLGYRRSGSMDHANTLNSANFLTGRGPEYRHFVGVVGEMTYGTLVGEEVDYHTIGRGDDGTDFSGGVQVKATDFDGVPNLMFPVRQWSRKIARIYVLVQVSWAFSRILGTITRTDADRVKKKVEFGWGATFMVRHEDLEKWEGGEEWLRIKKSLRH